MAKITQAELSKIINLALTEMGKCSNRPVNTEISQFVFKYNQFIHSNEQLNLFDDYLPTKNEIYNAVSFCNHLELYRQASDPYADETIELGQDVWRKLYQEAELHRNCIEPSNLHILNGIISAAKYHLPEFRPSFLLSQYSQQVNLVLNERKRQQKQKRKQEPYNKDYERMAEHLLKEISQDSELKAIKPCREKIELLQQCLKIVDCLSPEKYKRTQKFDFKRRLYLAISKTARCLDKPDEELQISAFQEARKYAKAIDKALSYADNSQIRNQRKQEEWFYR